jgi:hypothetical protein
MGFHLALGLGSSIYILAFFFFQLQKRVFFWGLWLPNFEKEIKKKKLTDPTSSSKLQQDGMMFEFFYFHIF